MGSFATFTIYAAIFYYSGLLIAEALSLPAWAAILAPFSIMAFQYALFPAIVERILSPIEWNPEMTAHPWIQPFLQEALKRQRLPAPAFGVISSSLPTLFSCRYGRKYRIVASSGLMGVLSREEIECLLALEVKRLSMGDPVIIRCTALLPVILNYLASRVLLFGRLMRNLRKTRTLSTFGLMLFWMARWSYTFLYFATRDRVRRVDRALHADPEYGPRLSPTLKNLERYLVEALSKMEEPEERIFALGFLSIADPRAAYEKSLALHMAWKNDQERVDCPDIGSPWRDYFEIFSSHPDIDRRTAEASDVLKQGERGAARAAKRASGTGGILVYFLPHLSIIGGILIFTLKGGSLGVPFLMGGVALFLKLLLQYRWISRKSTEIDKRPQPLPLSAIACTPLGLRGRICREKRLFINPYLLIARGAATEIPILLKSPYPVESILEDEWEEQDVLIFGWLRNAPAVFIEVQEITRDGKRLYRSYAPVALGIIAACSAIFGLFIILLQMKGG
jgi:Zn-dependent protease with chaperone function